MENKYFQIIFCFMMLRRRHYHTKSWVAGYVKNGSTDRHVAWWPLKSLAKVWSERRRVSLFSETRLIAANLTDMQKYTISLPKEFFRLGMAPVEEMGSFMGENQALCTLVMCWLRCRAVVQQSSSVLPVSSYINDWLASKESHHWCT